MTKLKFGGFFLVKRAIPSKLPPNSSKYELEDGVHKKFVYPYEYSTNFSGHFLG